nr:metalloproteinase inhibitor 4-like [Misgurnus anguillicaudatus]
MGGTLLYVMLIFLSIGLNKQAAEGCSCFPIHPQIFFCNSRIAVILAEVTSEEIVSEDTKSDGWGSIRYQIKVIKVFNSFNNTKQIQYVYTHQDEGICGIRLERSLYVLSGTLWNDDGIVVKMCNLVRHWDSLSLTEQQNLNQTLQMSCNCTVSLCIEKPCCVQSPKDCVWVPFTSHALEYACLENSDGSCSWYRGDSKDPQNDKMAICKPRRSSTGAVSHF